MGLSGRGQRAGSPETTAAQAMGAKAPIGFPVSNRSLVLDLGETRLVHQLIMYDNKLDSSGKSPLIAKYGLRLYISDDGNHFTPYTKAFKITVESGKQEGVFETARIDGLVILARYIKLHADLPTMAYDFANTNLQQMVRAYRDPSLTATVAEVHVDRYVVGLAKIYARIEMPEKDGGQLWLEVFDSKGSKLDRVAVPKGGIVKHETDVMGSGYRSASS